MIVKVLISILILLFSINNIFSVEKDNITKFKSYVIIKDVENRKGYEKQIESILNDIDLFDDYLVNIEKKKYYDTLDFLMIEELSKQFYDGLIGKKTVLNNYSLSIKSLNISLDKYMNQLNRTKSKIIKIQINHGEIDLSKKVIRKSYRIRRENEK